MIKIPRNDNERVQMLSLESCNSQEYDFTCHFCISWQWDVKNNHNGDCEFPQQIIWT